MLLTSKYKVDILGCWWHFGPLWVLRFPFAGVLAQSPVSPSLIGALGSVCTQHPYVFASVFLYEQRSLVFHHAIVVSVLSGRRRNKIAGVILKI